MSYCSEGDDRDRWVSRRAKSFGPSVIVEMSRLAQERGAINLAEGFPDHPAPLPVKESAVDAILQDRNQYTYDTDLADQVARSFSASSGLPVDAASQVVLTCGQTGAFAAVCLAVLNEGDEVLLLEPAFEAYSGAIMLAGGTPVFVPRCAPHWLVDADRLAAAVTSRTKAIVVNSPCNPTGHVLSLDELSIIAASCQAHDLLAITDEVYQHYVYEDSKPHISLASLPGMQHRSIVTSSASKTFHITGWRIGWAIAPPSLSPSIAAVSAKLIDSPPSSFQQAARTALSLPPSYYEEQRQSYLSKRQQAVSLALSLGLEVEVAPEGGFFVWACIPQHWNMDDVQLCKIVINKAGVAFVPGRIFFSPDESDASAPSDGSEPSSGNGCVSEQHSRSCNEGSIPSRHRYVRIAFCKKGKTLMEAQTLLSELGNVGE